jgi:hypothetical protein
MLIIFIDCYDFWYYLSYKRKIFISSNQRMYIINIKIVIYLLFACIDAKILVYSRKEKSLYSDKGFLKFYMKPNHNKYCVKL